MTHITAITAAAEYLLSRDYAPVVPVDAVPRSKEDIMMDSVNLINELITIGNTDQDTLDTIKRNVDYLQSQEGI